MSIYRKTMIRNEDIRVKVQMTSENKIQKVRLRWFEHLKTRCAYAPVRR